MENYNYEHFDPKEYNFKTFVGPKPGELYVDFEATTLNGEKVRLSTYLDKPIVLETGSITCPIYASRTKAMNKLMHDHPEVHFLLLYIREAHPGKRTAAIKHFEEKMEHAKSARELYDERREILVDDLDGTAHQLYGSMPNMTYLIGQDGIIRFRANWTNIDALERILNQENKELIIKEDFYDLEKPNPLIAIRTLLIGGVDALIEFLITLPQLLKQHKEVKRGDDIKS